MTIINDGDRIVGVSWVEDGDRIIDAAERRELVPYSDMHVWRLERDGKFPRRIPLGAKRVGWSLREVQEWIEARKAGRFDALEQRRKERQDRQAEALA